MDRNRSLKAIADDLQGQSEFCKAQKTAYRADIDGLRAVAVLSVLGFHYFGPLFPGGYVGVDIFFVISGYLLSGIIISELEEGQFSFRRFYERRIRRIFPALFALLFVSTIFSAFFLVTPDFRSYLRSAFAASWSASNIFFWRTSNYFDAPAADWPMLHAWSLAVEEQFYLVFPVFMFVVNRYLKRYLNIVVVVAAIASFAVSCWQVRVNECLRFIFRSDEPGSCCWALSYFFASFLHFRRGPSGNSRP